MIRDRRIQRARHHQTILLVLGGRPLGFRVLITNCSNNYGPYYFPENLIALVLLNTLERKLYQFSCMLFGADVRNSSAISNSDDRD